MCTRAFIGSYKPNQTPGQILDNMRDYAAKKNMPQTIKMHSNKEFKEGDASWFALAPRPYHSNPDSNPGSIHPTLTLSLQPYHSKKNFNEGDAPGSL